MIYKSVTYASYLMKYFIYQSQKQANRAFQCVGELIEQTSRLGGIVLVTADHGNAEEVFLQKGDEKIMKTSHTLNPVSFTIVDTAYNREYRLRDDIVCPGLVNVAATVFNLMGYEAPSGYEPSLIRFVNGR